MSMLSVFRSCLMFSCIIWVAMLVRTVSPTIIPWDCAFPPAALNAGDILTITSDCAFPSRWVVTLAGTVQSPILVTANSPVVLSAPGELNAVVHIDAGEYFTFENVTISAGGSFGQGLSMFAVSNAIVRNLVIVQTAKSCITLSGDNYTASNITIQNCNLTSCGAPGSNSWNGIDVGVYNLSTRSYVAQRIVIAHNYIWNAPSGRCITIGEGSSSNQVLDNVLSNCAMGGIQVQQLRTGASAGTNVIARNFIYGVPGTPNICSGIQIEADTEAVNNIIYMTTNSDYGIQVAGALAVRNVRIMYNTVAGPAQACLRILSYQTASPDPFEISGNAFLCPTTSQSVSAGPTLQGNSSAWVAPFISQGNLFTNISTVSWPAVNETDAPSAESNFVNLNLYNFYPTVGSLLASSATSSVLSWTQGVDFALQTRSTGTYGALEYTSTPLDLFLDPLGFKPSLPSITTVPSSTTEAPPTTSAPKNTVTISATTVFSFSPTVSVATSSVPIVSCSAQLPPAGFSCDPARNIWVANTSIILSANLTSEHPLEVHGDVEMANPDVTIVVLYPTTTIPITVTGNILISGGQLVVNASDFDNIGLRTPIVFVSGNHSGAFNSVAYILKKGQLCQGQIEEEASGTGGTFLVLIATSSCGRKKRGSIVLISGLAVGIAAILIVISAIVLLLLHRHRKMRRMWRSGLVDKDEASYRALS